MTRFRRLTRIIAKKLDTIHVRDKIMDAGAVQLCCSHLELAVVSPGSEKALIAAPAKISFPKARPCEQAMESNPHPGQILLSFFIARIGKPVFRRRNRVVRVCCQTDVASEDETSRAILNHLTRLNFTLTL